MSTIYHDPNNFHAQSLIERKKLQWAREKEELAGLSEHAPWNSRETIQLYERPYIKTGYVTRYQKETEYLRRDSLSIHSASATPRKYSLPPLHKNQNFTYSPGEKSDKEMGGETSGYGSDNQTQTPEHFPKALGVQETTWASNKEKNTGGGYESSSSGREDRLKWDVAANRFWKPQENVAEEIASSRGTPGWVRRGLERDTELVVANSSPAESPEQDYGERPCTGSSSTCANRSYLLGQNVRVGPEELAERERKRQKAIEHQEAIRQQLEEREKKREEERARKVREEYEEERRIAREQELERQRQAQELQQREEKEERERKRREALKEAIEIAEREAKEEKRKQRMLRQVNINNLNNTANDDREEKNDDHKGYKNKSNLEMKITEKSQIEISEVKKPEAANKENIKEQIISDMEAKMPPEQNLVLVNQNTVSNSSSNGSIASTPSTASATSLPTHETLAMVIQQSPLIESLQNVQFVLIPTAVNQMIPNFHLINRETLNNSVDKSVCNTARTEDRLLTPTQYRMKNKTVCDMGTQTDFQNLEKMCEKISNLEISYSRNSRRSKLRSRSEMRNSETEERPKWGVNRPPTRYLKQSEKDPLYQRRKMRQKMRQKGYSSDDSQGSPRSYRKKIHSRERGTWRKNPDCEAVRIYQTEIIPLECDRDRIFYNHHHCVSCQNSANVNSKSFRPLCCNCKCQCSQNGPKRFCEESDGKVDVMKIEDLPRLPSCTNNNEYISEGNSVLDKLTSIHNDLMLKDNWDNDRNQILYSPLRNS